MSRQCILTLKSGTKSVKVVRNENGAYKNTYYEIMSNRKRICRPFGYDNEKEAIEVALNVVLPKTYINQGDC